MSDLSQLLGDLYADENPVPKAPEWSSDEALDDAFSSWVPGPAEGSAPAERALVADALDDEPKAVMPVTDDDWLAITASAMPAEDVVEPMASAGHMRWSPSDDDILPTRAKARFALSLRRR